MGSFDPPTMAEVALRAQQHYMEQFDRKAQMAAPQNVNSVMHIPALDLYPPNTGDTTALLSHSMAAYVQHRAGVSFRSELSRLLYEQDRAMLRGWRYGSGTGVKNPGIQATVDRVTRQVLADHAAWNQDPEVRRIADRIYPGDKKPQFIVIGERTSEPAPAPAPDEKPWWWEQVASYKAQGFSREKIAHWMASVTGEQIEEVFVAIDGAPTIQKIAIHTSGLLIAPHYWSKVVQYHEAGFSIDKMLLWLPNCTRAELEEAVADLERQRRR